jgi:hypothetical protein
MCSGTGLYTAKKPSLNAPSPIRIVKDTLNQLGCIKIGYPYIVHSLMGFAFLNFLPDTGAKMLAIMKLAKQRNENAGNKKQE